MKIEYFKNSLINLSKRKELLYILVKKQLREKHVGSLLGYFWSFYTALLPLFSYVFVFFFIAKVRVAGAESGWLYIIYVFSGILPWLFFMKVVTESIDSLSANLDLLRQAIFPVEIITFVSVTENLVNFLIQCCCLIILIALNNYSVLYKLYLLPVFIFCMYLFCLGLGWLLSIAGFFLRDLKDIVSSSMQLLIYITPVLYRKENVPENLWFLFVLNPITHMINFFRDVVYNPSITSTNSIIIFVSISVIIFLCGFCAIIIVKKTIADMV